MSAVNSNRGYALEASALFERYERLSFDFVHRNYLHLLPTAPSRYLDIGSGTGRDAAALAAKGHRVTAVEPTDELRIGAARIHPSPDIEWVNDRLPELETFDNRANQFDAVTITAVWMHLDAEQRARGLPRIARLLRPAGVLCMSVRHGPIPEGRRMFEVSGEETIALAKKAALTPVLHLENQPSSMGTPGVSWTSLVFSKRHLPQA